MISGKSGPNMRILRGRDAHRGHPDEWRDHVGDLKSEGLYPRMVPHDAAVGTERDRFIQPGHERPRTILSKTHVTGPTG